MARPTQTRLGGGPGLALDNNRAPSLQVVAPLNVNAAPSGAELLAQSLGIAQQAVAPELARRAQQDTFDATSEGRAAGTMNAVDEKRQAEDRNYAFGVKRAMVDRAVVDFKSQARSYYEEQFDKSQGTEVLLANLDGIAKGALEGYASDPDAARWMAGEVQAELARITGEHDKMLADQFKEDRIASASALMRDAIAERRPIDPEEIMSRMRPVLGNSGATQAYAQMVGALAVEHASPELIDLLIPEKWADGTPGPRSVPALNQALNQSRYYARAAADEKDRELNSVAAAQADDVLMRATLDALRGVDPEAISVSLAEAVANGLPVKDSDVRSIIGFARSSRDDAREQRLDPMKLAEFRAELIDNPQDYTTADLITFVAQNYAPGREGMTQANMLIDDYIQAQRAANEIDGNPVAKADRAYFRDKYKPAEYASEGERDTYYQGMRLFDKTLIDTRDPEKARQAAEQHFKDRPPIESTRSTNDVRKDVMALLDKKLSPTEFRQAWGGDRAAQNIAELQSRGTIDRETALRAINALRPTQ